MSADKVARAEGAALVAADELHAVVEQVSALIGDAFLFELRMRITRRSRAEHNLGYERGRAAGQSERQYFEKWLATLSHAMTVQIATTDAPSVHPLYAIASEPDQTKREMQTVALARLLMACADTLAEEGAK